MKNFLKTKISSVVAGLFTASIVMMIFEYVNSLFFPLPKDLDLNDIRVLHAFTASLPWNAYILVFLGWVIGSFKAGVVTTYFSKEQKFRLSLTVGLILTILGVINNVLIGHNMIFNVVALPMFIIFTYLGHRYMKVRTIQ